VTARYRPRRNQLAVERQLKAMRAAGRIEDVDAGVVALARSTAAALDDAGQAARLGSTAWAEVASIARAHLAAVQALRGTGQGESVDEVDRLLAALSGPMGDPAQS
jgi:hypothetical protein